MEIILLSCYLLVVRGLRAANLAASIKMVEMYFIYIIFHNLS